MATSILLGRLGDIYRNPYLRMTSPHQTPPFHIQPVGKHLFELKVEHEVELVEEDFAPIQHIHELVLRRQPVALLVNRAHHFSYSFALQKRVCNLPNLIAMAFLVRSTGQQATVMVKPLLDAAYHDYPITVCDDRVTALEWLRSQESRREQLDLF